MIVDIGGGTTDMAVISLGAPVVSASIKVAGDDFDEAIIRYIRKRHNMLIGERTAEDLKINVGAAFERSGDVRMDVRGQNLVTGLPGTISISSEDMQEALKEPVTAIMETIHSVFERTPPELAGDIIDRGMVLTGGASLLFGLDKLIKHQMGIEAIIADDAVSCVAVGTGMYIEYLARQGSGRRSSFSSRR